jgi:hypothetical protein
MPVNAIGLSSKNLDMLLDGISRSHGLLLFADLLVLVRVQRFIQF